MDRRSENEIIFRTDDVTKVYDTGEVKVYALAGVDLELYASELTVLLGPSGSGKSTLLNILGGLDHATSGDVWFRDLQLSALNDRELTRYRRDNVGFVFQFFHLMPSLTAFENVLVPLEIAGAAAAGTRAAALLSDVGLDGRAHHYPAQLSGGEQQRVAIARALANDPPILLADEPTGNLDSANGRHIVELLHKVNADRDMTVVLVTHDTELASSADVMLQMRDGEVEQVTPERPPEVTR